MSSSKRLREAVSEATALKMHYDLDPPELQAAIESARGLWTNPDATPDQLEEAVDAIKNAIEDICLEHKISEEELEPFASAMAAMLAYDPEVKP